MSVMAELRASLDAMGVEQQACVFVFLMTYPLTLGALLGSRGRRVAAGMAAIAVVCFAVFTNPWFHAVLLAALAIGAIGLFIAAVYVIDRVSRHWAFKGLPIEEVEFVDSDEPQSEPSESLPVSGRPRFPIVGVVSVRH